MIGPIRDTVVGVLAARPAVVVLEMLAVTYLGEAGVGLLFEAVHLAGPGGHPACGGHWSALRRKVEVAGLASYLSRYDSPEAALIAS